MFMQKIARFTATSLIMVSMSGGAIAAGQKPKPSFPVGPKEVIAIYLGNTWEWSKGGAYWGNGGKFEAFYEDEVAVGKWYVTTRGTLCYEANWYERNGNKTPLKRCWEHVKDKDGNYYQQPTDPEQRKKYGWGKVAKVSNGNKIMDVVRKLRRAAGI